MIKNPVLIIFGGLPGSGKTTIARTLAQKIKAVYLRIDTIETALKKSSLKITDVAEAGYYAAFDIAKDNLDLGHIVVADSVNACPLSRDAWQNVARSTKKDFIEIEVFCSDPVEHKKRIQERVIDIKELIPPTWEQVQARDYHYWDVKGLRIDTAKQSVDAALEAIVAFLEIRKNTQMLS